MTPAQQIGHYRITSKLGEGGMGEVWRAKDTQLGREVAIKTIPQSFAQDAERMARFTREAQVMASLNHSNIAAIYGVEQGALVMELVDGPTLAERIAQGPMPLAEALPIARQIADALDYAHERGVVHRDLKPANVKLTGTGSAKVLDFGLAKALANDAVAADPASSPTITLRATMAGVIMGTAAYMSPEQARGAAVDKRADIWAFGVVLYELLTAHRLFEGETVSDSIAAVLTRDPDLSLLPADTPASIRRLLQRCLTRDRKRRLSDIADARLEIDDAVERKDEPARVASPKRTRSTPILAALAGISALVAVALAFVHLGETAQDSAAVRFSIPVPLDANFGPSGLALSPDGRKLAFVAAVGSGLPMLWVRALDSLQTQMIAGTEGAMFAPFWSPDGQSLGYSTGSKLMRVDLASGVVRTLCSLDDGAGQHLVGTEIVGGTWSRDDVILFSTPVSGILRVGAGGGLPTEIMRPDESRGEVGHLRPWFLPDGRNFLYFSRSQYGQGNKIFLSSVDTKTRTPLVASNQAGLYASSANGSRDGHLLFMRERTLMAQQLDVDRRSLVGEPFPVAEQVGALRALGFFGVSQTGVLAFRTGPGDDGRSELAWIDRSGKVTGTLGVGNYYALELSPDGSRVAVDRGDGYNRDIWILDTKREAATRLTFHPATDSAPIWTPDGREVVFTSERANGRLEIYAKPADGSAPERHLMRGSALDWSPDGKYLLYGTRGDTTLGDMWVAPRNGEPFPYLATQVEERQAQVSPDGRWVAYVEDQTSRREFRVYVQSFPTPSAKFQVSTDIAAQPRWRADGKELFYMSRDAGLMAVDVRTSPTFSAGTPRALFRPIITGRNSLWAAYQYDVSRDGSRFVVNRIAATSKASNSAINVVLNWQQAAGAK